MDELDPDRVVLHGHRVRLAVGVVGQLQRLTVRLLGVGLEGGGDLREGEKSQLKVSDDFLPKILHCNEPFCNLLRKRSNSATFICF